MKRKIKIGMRFERLVVIGETKRQGKLYWDCKCDCGKEKSIIGNSLLNGLTKSCGCLHKEICSKKGYKCFRDLKNQRFGRLLVESRNKEHQPDGRSAYWNCISLSYEQNF